MPGSALRPLLERTLLSAWHQKGALAWLLLPLACTLFGITALRRLLYQWRMLPVRRVNTMVIVVGNVITGGAGKTPTVISLVQHLRSLGLDVGVVSRGYGRKSTGSVEVLPDSAVDQVGDEPLLVRRATQVPVWVGSSRFESACALLAQYPQTDIIICDDGLQHYGLYRDLEVCVFDNRGCGNGWTLPAGPLREPWPRRALSVAGQAADRLLVLHTGDQPAFDGFRAKRQLADRAVRQDASTLALHSLQAATGKPLMAVAGIAQPDVFFAMLRQRGLSLARTVSLPDHYDFDSYLRNEYVGYQLVCTEKDSAKLWKLAPDALAVPLLQTAEPAFWKAIDAHVAAHIDPSMPHPLAAKLSS